MQVTVIAYLHAHPSTRSALAQNLHQIVQPTREEPGCLSMQVLSSEHDPREFFTVSRWESAASYAHHTRMNHTQGFLERVRPLLDRPLRVTLTRELFTHAE